MKYIIEFKDGRPSEVFEAKDMDEAYEIAHRIAWDNYEGIEDENDFVTHPAYMDPQYYSVHSIEEPKGE